MPRPLQPSAAIDPPSHNRVARQVVVASFVIQFMTIGGMFAYSVFFPELEKTFGWSRTLLSGVSSTSILVMGMLAAFGGQISDRFGPRWVLTATGLIYGIGYALMSLMQAPWQLIVLFGVLGGIGLSTHDVVTLSTVARWFPQRRGQMTGIVKVGTAAGQICMPLAATALIAWLGWRSACLVIGIGAGVVLVAAAQAMRAGPSGAGQQTATDRSASPKPAPSDGLSFAQIRRTRQFWTMCLIQFLFFPILTTIPLHIVVHGTDLGLSTASAASVLSVIAASSILGRLSVGPAIDRFGGRVGYTFCFLMLLSSLLILRFTDAAWVLFGFAVIYGIGHGGLFTMVAPAIAEYFGLRAHGTAFGLIIFFGTIGGALGPLITGHLFDASGSYDTAFTLLALSALAGLLMAQTLSAVRHHHEARPA